MDGLRWTVEAAHRMVSGVFVLRLTARNVTGPLKEVSEIKFKTSGDIGKYSPWLAFVEDGVYQRMQ